MWADVGRRRRLALRPRRLRGPARRDACRAAAARASRRPRARSGCWSGGSRHRSRSPSSSRAGPRAPAGAARHARAARATAWSSRAIPPWLDRVPRWEPRGREPRGDAAAAREPRLRAAARLAGRSPPAIALARLQARHAVLKCALDVAARRGARAGRVPRRCRGPRRRGWRSRRAGEPAPRSPGGSSRVLARGARLARGRGRGARPGRGADASGARSLAPGARRGWRTRAWGRPPTPWRRVAARRRARRCAAACAAPSRWPRAQRARAGAAGRASRYALRGTPQHRVNAAAAVLLLAAAAPPERTPALPARRARARCGARRGRRRRARGLARRRRAPVVGAWDRWVLDGQRTAEPRVRRAPGRAARGRARLGAGRAHARLRARRSPHRRRLETILGFSSGALPTLFTGRLPSEHGRWLMYRRARGARRALPRLRLAARCCRRGCARSWRLAAAAHRGWSRGAACAATSTSTRCRASCSRSSTCAERDDIFAPGGLPGDSLWDTLERRGVRWRGWNWRTPEAEALAALERALDERAPRTSCSATLPISTRCCTGRARAARACASGWRATTPGSRGSRGAAARRGEALWLVAALRPRHGGRARDRGRDGRAGAAAVRRWPRDYVPFFDSTFARFWWRSAAARARGARRARGPRGGPLARRRRARARGGAASPARDYGEDMFLLDPGRADGALVHGLAPLAAMHGYDPAHPDMAGAAAASNRPVPGGRAPPDRRARLPRGRAGAGWRGAG